MKEFKVHLNIIKYLLILEEMSAALSLIQLQLHGDISARRDTNIIEYVMENSTSKLFFFSHFIMFNK